MESLLGPANEYRGDTAIYEIQGTGDVARDGTQIGATDKLLVNYADSPEGGDRAEAWRVQ